MNLQTYNPNNYTNTEWLKTIEYTQEPNRRALLATFAILGIPRSLLDIGCGDGSLIEYASKLIQGWWFVRGVDIVEPQNEYCIEADLREPLITGLGSPDKRVYTLAPDFEMVVSWEVGEHLPIACSSIYADTLATFTEKWLVFTAAIPGQGGDFHINEQQPEFWRELLEERGLTYHPDLTEILRDAWKVATGPCFWLPQNLQVFERLTR